MCNRNRYLENEINLRRENLDEFLKAEEYSNRWRNVKKEDKFDNPEHSRRHD